MTLFKEQKGREHFFGKNMATVIQQKATDNNGYVLECKSTELGICSKLSTWSLFSSSATDLKLYCFFVAMSERYHHDFVIRSHET